MNERSILIGALERDDPEQRSAYLTNACGGDAQLRERVERLLAAHAADGGVLDRPLVEGDKTSLLHSTAEGAGVVIAGRYKLLEVIAEGGMGTVWVAQQTEPVRRRVALKLIKPGMDSRQVLSRFESERQALALMDHPNIAKILDGGITEQGRPFFAMELVKGVPITEYCDRVKLTVADRLKLLVQVCQAVQHAHQKGIIHRDLKPSNILVCLYDGRPVPKVIDFGLAKAMNNSLTEHSLYTAFGLMVGTPLYMSPEQAEFNNLDIDTRSDVYSLGVILYELLTGTTPLDRQRFKDAAWQEIVRLIKEEEATKPSTKLSGSGSLPTIAAQRSLEPAQLSRAVRGDLDWIVLKSLEKERTRRYETANGLARDIERYLNDQPVEACPPSSSYRFRKFARRNRVALVTASLVSIALVTGTVVSLWQAVRATRAERVANAERVHSEQARAKEAEQRAIAENQRKSADAARIAEAEQRNVAEANFQKARAAVDDYFTLVSESTLFEVPGLQPLRKDLLERALRFYEESSVSRTQDSSVLADAAVTYLRVGMIYFSLNRTDDSIVAIRKALDIVDHMRREGPEAVNQLPRVAGFWRGLRWTQFVTFEPRDPIGTFTTLLRLEKTWSQLAEQFPTQLAFQSDLAPVQALIAFGWKAAGRLKDSEISHRKALALVRRLLREQPQVAQFRNDFLAGARNMADVLLANGKADESKALLSEAVQMGEALVVEFPKNPNYRFHLSECHRVLGRQIDTAEPGRTLQHFRRAAELAQAIMREYPAVDTYYQAWQFAASGWLQASDALGDVAQANEVLRDSIRSQELVTAYRRDDATMQLDMANTMLNLAQRLGKDPGQAREAEDLRRRAGETWDRTIAAIGQRSATLHDEAAQVPLAEKLNDIAWTLTTAGESALRDTTHAIKLAQRAVELSPATARFWNTLGMAHYRGAEFQAGIDAFAQALAREPNNEWSFYRMRDLVNDRAGTSDQQVLIDKVEAALANDPQYVHWCAIRGRWADAAAALEKCIKKTPNDHYPWFQAAFVLAIEGDVEKYRRHCDEMLARFGSTQDPGIAERTAKACLILAPPDDQLGILRELTERAVATGSNHEFIRYYQLARALADYRAGEFSKATEGIDKCLDSDKPMGGYGVAMAQLLSVMTQARLGNEQKAQAEWPCALQFCDNLPRIERGQLLYPSDWHDGIGVELLRRETEPLLKATLKSDAKTTLDERPSSIGAVADPP